MIVSIRITKARADLLAFIRDNPSTSLQAQQGLGATVRNHIAEQAAWLLANGLIREVYRIRIGTRGPCARVYEITPYGRAALTLCGGGLIDSPKSFNEVTYADLERLASRETTTQRV